MTPSILDLVAVAPLVAALVAAPDTDIAAGAFLATSAVVLGAHAAARQGRDERRRLGTAAVLIAGGSACLAIAAFGTHGTLAAATGVAAGTCGATALVLAGARRIRRGPAEVAAGEIARPVLRLSATASPLGSIDALLDFGVGWVDGDPPLLVSADQVRRTRLNDLVEEGWEAVGWPVPVIDATATVVTSHHPLPACLVAVDGVVIGAIDGEPLSRDRSTSDRPDLVSNRARVALAYVGLLAGVLAALQGLLWLGSHLRPAASGAGTRFDPVPGPAVDAFATDVLWRLLLAAAVIVAAARLVGAVMRRVHQPQVIGEIIAGILLGPSALGAVWPEAQSFLFPTELLPHLDLLANVGLIFFMFLVGLQLDVRLMRGRGRAAVWVSHASILAPFLLGVGLALLLFPVLGPPTTSFTSFALFVGASMSITAFPVLARMLTERGLHRTSLGVVTFTCAAVDDVTAWCLLAVVVTVARATGAIGAITTIAFSLVFIAAMVLAVRPLLQRVATYHEERGRLSGSAIAALFVGIILAALITDRIGIHVIFGAFLFGAVMPQRAPFIEELADRIEDFSTVLLLPIFFALSGLQTQIGLLGTDAVLWSLTAAVLVVAVLGKWGGSTLAARLVGLDRRESSALGALMNCRGLTGLIVLNVGLQLEVLPPTLFTMLVLMAVVTTLMTEPLLAHFYPRDEQRRILGASEERAGDPPPERWRVLVPVERPATSDGLIRAATLLAGQRPEHEVEVIILHVVPLPAHAYRLPPGAREGLIEDAADSLRPLVDLVRDVGFHAVPVVSASSGVAGAIVRVAHRREADLILLGQQRATAGDGLALGTVGDVLRQARPGVAVLVDPAGGRGLSLLDGGRILVPHGGELDEDGGLEIALQLGAATGAEIVPVAGDVLTALIDRVRGTDLLVLGVTNRWIRDHAVPGRGRRVPTGRLPVPLLLVRGASGRRAGGGLFARLTRRDHRLIHGGGRGRSAGAPPRELVAAGRPSAGTGPATRHGPRGAIPGNTDPRGGNHA